MARFSFLRMAVQCLARPRLLARLAGAAWCFRRRGWYRRPPFLPLPSTEYMRWRLHTAFGDEQAAPNVADLDSYLKWAAWMRQQRDVEAFRRTDAY